MHVLLFTILCFLYPSFPTDNLKGHKGKGQQRSRETKQDEQTKLMKPANTMERRSSKKEEQCPDVKAEPEDKKERLQGKKARKKEGWNRRKNRVEK